MNMRELTSGVYYVDSQNIRKFIDHAYKSGWQWLYTNVHDELEPYIKANCIIPFCLESGENRIGYWSEYMCHNQEEVLKQMENWTDWNWTDKYIEYYKPKTILL